MAQETRKIGRYQITRELGRGAMGVVYHAIDPTIGRPVAIKTLRLRELDDGDERSRLRERLFREARSAGALSHPGIVTIYDMDEVDGLAYIAMEFVDGDTLDDLLRQPAGLSRERVMEVLTQAAAALDYAHRKGIIHRDIKPANIMIDTAGAVKITDFGIAKITQMEGQTLTGVLIGTPNYMSPEQVQGAETDGRSDQFSLAVIAYEMLTGERPFHGEQISTVVYKIVTAQPVPAQNVNTTLNEAIDKVLRRGLAKKPERRFASCTAFASALTGALDNTKNWRVLPQKAYQNNPTAAVTGTMPQAQKFLTGLEKKKLKRKAPASKPRSWLLPFFAAFLFLIALLGVVAWQAGVLDIPLLRNWLPEEKAAVTPTESAAPDKAEANPAGGTPETPVNPSTDGASSFPPALSPSGNDASQPAKSDAPAKQDAPTVAAAKPDPAAVNATFQQLQIMSDPAAARATLDGLGDAVCQTPCSLRVRSGVHTLTVTRDGYQPESREITVAHEDIDYPLITLRSANGILLLTSDPSSAHVWLDGRPTDYVTPVRISLPAGDHTVAIQKNGLQSSDRVHIENGALSTLKLGVKRQ
jgi:serine/threonine-protein kinase